MYYKIYFTEPLVLLFGYFYLIIVVWLAIIQTIVNLYFGDS
jgi:hypothetical protein